MKNNQISNFVLIDSIYGKFIVNRHCHFQAEALIKTGRTHIEDELKNIFALVDSLPDSSIIIDGGTNIGFFSIPVAQRLKGKGAKVLGFEPQKMIYYAVAGSVALNDLDNCFLYNAGLSNKSGDAQLPQVDYSKPFDFGTISIADNPKDTAKDYLDDQMIHTISIDEMNLPRLDFIKLDIEGHEPQAIIGGINTIRKYRPLLWVEYFITGQDAIKECLTGIDGYSFHIIDLQNILCIPDEKLLEMGITINQNA